MTQTTFNLHTAPGHQVLAAAGKKILRPGGRAATAQLFEWADFQPDQTVLELASSFGYSAIALAQRYGVRVMGVEKNPESVERARANIAAAGLSDRIEIVLGDIFHLEQIPGQYDYVLAEAILTMQSGPGKAKILAGVADRLKPNGKFLSHELLVRANSEQVCRALAGAIRVNAQPLTEANWIKTCQAAGLTIQHCQTRAMGLLNPFQMIQDEGFLATLKIVGHVLSQPVIRQRVLAMRRVFRQYRRELGAIVLCGTKSEKTENFEES